MPIVPFHVPAPSLQAELISAALLYVPASFPFAEPLPTVPPCGSRGSVHTPTGTGSLDHDPDLAGEPTRPSGYLEMGS